MSTHNKLIELGFTHTHYDDSLEDVGDGESGPMISGGPEFDEYLHKETNTKVIIVKDKIEYFGEADQFDFEE